MKQSKSVAFDKDTPIMIYGLILTLCLNGQCNQTIPEAFYSMEDCAQALQELDRKYSASYELFKCEAIED